jgi:uncharacterized membrane protein
MDLMNQPHSHSATYWNDDARQLATVVGGVALAAYVLMHPRVLKLAVLLGAAELFRRNVPMNISMPTLSSGVPRQGEGMNVRAAITIGCEPQAAYSYWRDLSKAPGYMAGVQEVRVVSEKVAVWRTKPLRGRSFSWVGETTDDIPGERIAWQMIGSDVLKGSGQVEFRSGLRPGTTEVVLRQEIFFPVTVSTRVTRSLMARQLEETLRKLKQILETGEVARTDGQPAGDRSIAGHIVHEYVRPVLIPS